MHSPPAPVKLFFYFVKKVKSPVSLHPFCECIGQPTGVSIVQNAGAFDVFTAYPSHALLAMHLQLRVFAFAAFSSRTEMICDAIII